LFPGIELALSQGGNSAEHPAIHPASLPADCLEVFQDVGRPDAREARLRFGLIPAGHALRRLIREEDALLGDDPREGRFVVLGPARRVNAPWAEPAVYGAAPWLWASKAIELTLARERYRLRLVEDRQRVEAHEREQRRLAMEASPSYQAA